MAAGDCSPTKVRLRSKMRSTQAKVLSQAKVAAWPQYFFASPKGAISDTTTQAREDFRNKNADSVQMGVSFGTSAHPFSSSPESPTPICAVRSKSPKPCSKNFPLLFHGAVGTYCNSLPYPRQASTATAADRAGLVDPEGTHEQKRYSCVSVVRSLRNSTANCSYQTGPPKPYLFGSLELWRDDTDARQRLRQGF